MPKDIKASPAVESTEVQLVDAPMMGGTKKKFALRPMDRVDSIIGTELLNNPPKDDEHIFASPTVLVFHDKKGEAKSFDKVQAVSSDGRPSIIGGWIRTTKPEEIEALDEYARVYSGSVRKVYPILVAE